jgi:hypothetical protein
MTAPSMTASTFNWRAISRKGNVVCRVIEDLGTDTLESFVAETVSDKVTLVATDEFAGYTLCIACTRMTQ